MASLSDNISHFRIPASRFLYVAGSLSLGTWILLRSLRNSLESDRPETAPSPTETALPQLSKEEIGQLPYPPDALPGARDVESQYGTTRVYEWGPENGRRILLIHGISTPSIALANVAHKLVEKGCRVMLFDLFGRGYSSTPSPKTHPYSSALYTTQILLTLQSSPIPWPSFTLIGYSLGGAISADFASYFPHLIDGLVLVAPGGLIRTNHITWKSKLLYSTGGLIPEWMIERLVAKRLWTGPASTRTIEPEPDTPSAPTDATKGGLKSQAVYLSANIGLLPGRPQSTVSNVVDWQILHQPGFVPAFISTIRYAPIHGQQHRWRVIRQNIENSVGKLKRVDVVLGETDPIIVAEELVVDAKEVLGEENIRIKIVKGSGHEVAIERSEEVVNVVEEMLQ